MLERPILESKFNFPLVMAPMVGISHRAFRRLARRYLPPSAVSIWPTEMLNSRRIPSQNLGQHPESFKDESESILCPQILCNEEWAIAQSIPKLEAWGAEAIDINMGCPVKKALRHNYGVSLMGDLNYAADVVRMAKSSSTVPISVKLRSGLELDREFLIDFGQALEGAGASWLSLHPRTAAQKRRGTANWELIQVLREHVKIPVIGNGDVQNITDLLQLLEQTSCDAVMVGRALTARPWLFWQLGEELGFSSAFEKEAPRTPKTEAQEMGICLQLLANYIYEDFSPNLAKRRFMFFLRYALAWLDFGNKLYGSCEKAKNLEEIIDILQLFFSKTEPKMISKTLFRQ